METLRISLIQGPLTWEKPEANRGYFGKQIATLQGKTDLILLPEMFSTGFSMRSKALAEPPNGPTRQWMQDQAQKAGSAIVGSVITKGDQNYYNRLYFVFPTGNYEVYDKHHLFTYAKEDKSYTPGGKKLIVDYKNWKICPLICFDLRFPVWARNREDYDLLLYIANWPKSRILHWDTLLRARSIENLCYTVGVNRIGIDGNNLEYNGHSAIYDALGQKITTSDWEKEFTETTILKKSRLTKVRKTFPFLKEKDSFKFI